MCLPSKPCLNTFLTNQTNTKAKEKQKNNKKQEDKTHKDLGASYSTLNPSLHTFGSQNHIHTHTTNHIILLLPLPGASPRQFSTPLGPPFFSACPRAIPDSTRPKCSPPNIHHNPATPSHRDRAQIPLCSKKTHVEENTSPTPVS